MNNEINEILDRIETASEIFDCLLKPEECTDLLDYITNLQQKIEQYENPDDMTLFYMWLDTKAKDKIKELQQENERLKTIKPCMLNFQECYVVKDYKSRCEKAIEYINKHPVNACHELLNILQNGSDNNV